MHRHRHMRVSLGLALLLGTMVTGPASAQRFLDLQPREVFTLGHADDGPTFGTIVGIAFAPGERLLVLDQMEGTVAVVSGAGSLIGRWGRRGEGPGELTRPTSIAVSGPGVVAIADGPSVELFTSTGGYQEAYPVLGVAQAVAFDARGDLVVQYAPLLNPRLPATLRVERLADGTVLWEAPNDRLEQVRVMFSPRPVVGFVGAFAVVGQSHQYSLNVIDLVTGQVTATIGRDVRQRAVSRGFERKVRRFLMNPSEAPAGWTSIVGDGSRAAPPQLLEQLSFHGSFPVVRRAFQGPAGSIWVERGAGLEDGLAAPVDPPDRDPTWDVFVDGRYLGTAQLPDGFFPYVGRHDRIAGVQLDGYGVHALRVLRVTLPDSGG